MKQLRKKLKFIAPKNILIVMGCVFLMLILKMSITLDNIDKELSSIEYRLMEISISLGHISTPARNRYHQQMREEYQNQKPDDSWKKQFKENHKKMLGM